MVSSALCVGLVLLQILWITDGRLDYAVIFPSDLRAHHPEKICLQLEGAEGGSNVELSLQLDDKNMTLIDKTFQEDSIFTCLYLQVPDPEKDKVVGTLTISIKTVGESITNTSKVHVRKKISKILIQTDKAVYKPGQTVRFRILSLNEDFKPENILIPIVEMKDPGQNRIGQWLNVSLNQGIAELSLLLSSEPKLGKYTIKVKDSVHDFSVEEYVLPKFEVDLQLPKNVMFNSEEFLVKICGRYTYGKPVQGNFSMSICRRYYSRSRMGSPEEPPICANFNGKLDRSGCQTIEIKSELFKLKKTGIINQLKGLGTITEEGTGVELSTSSQTSISTVINKLSFVNADRNYKLGMPYSALIKVEDADSNPIPGTKVFLQSRSNLVNRTLVTDENGLAAFSLNTSNWKDRLYLKAKTNLDTDPYIMGEIRANYGSASLIIDPFYSRSKSFMKIHPLDRDLPCEGHQEILVEYIIDYNELMETKRLNLHYLLVSKMSIKDSGSKEINIEKSEDIHGKTTLNFHLSGETSKSVHVFVYILLPNGEIIADSEKFNNQRCFKNKVSTEFSPDEVLPGSDVSLQVRAAPGSLCGLRVVDQSVVLMKPEKELTLDKVLTYFPHLESIWYDSNIWYAENPCKTRNFIHERSFIPLASSLWFGEDKKVDVYSLLKELHLKIITSADIQQPVKCFQPPDIMRRGKGRHESSGTSSRVVVTSSTTARMAAMEPQETEKVRTYFPETWIWKLVPLGETGSAELHYQAPDTITDWNAGAICLGPSGFGLSPSSSLRVFQPFFVDLTLPYSVVRGESFTLKASVFNYLKQCIKVQTTLRTTDELEQKPCPDCQYSSCLCADESKTFFWNLKASKLGEVNITVKTEAVDTKEFCGNEIPVVPKQGRTDTIVKTVLVQPGGILEEKSHSSLICIKEGVQPKPEEISLKIPENILEDSARAHITVLGDLMGTAMQNLDRLLAMPYGCGEQNMVLFAPNIFVLQYLEKSHQANTEIQSKARKFMESGYQRQLTYKRDDGSYSAFGKNDKEGNTWLTAFVVKSFSKARPYIFIDESHLNHSFSWLKNNQQDTGCFRSVGRLFNNAMKGGVEDDISLSAYITLALLEAKVSVQDPLVRNALSCLKKASVNSSNVYTQALLAYTFTLSGDTELTKTLMDILEEKAVQGDGQLHWKRDSAPPSEVSYWYRAPSAEVELTSYVLLALLSGPTQDLGKASLIVNWLSKQQNPYGGYSSTQDTVVALQALAKYAEVTFTDEGDVTVVVSSKTGFLEQFNVDKNNRLLLQRAKLSTIPEDYTVTTTGKGCIFVQAVLRYNIPPPKDEATFSLAIKSSSTSQCLQDPVKHFEVLITAAYTGTREKSNMAVIEVKMLSGYIPVKSTIKKLEKDKLIQRSDIRTDMVTLYLDQLDHNPVNLSFMVEQDIVVKNLKPAPAKVYDYYETDEQATAEYTYPCSTAMKDLYLFSRKLILKKLHSRSGVDMGLNSVLEREALKALEDLLQEQICTDQGRFPKSVIPRSQRFPPLSICPQVEIFTKMVINDFKTISSNRKNDNLTKKQRDALNELKSYEDVVYKAADKGGNIVIWPTEKYEKEAFRQLRDKKTYQKLTHNPVISFSAELFKILTLAHDKGIIPKNVLSGLMTQYPRIPTLYFLPKVHKNMTDPPGRPIVSGIGGLCDPICRFIDHYLKSSVECLPSYVRDTTDVLKRIDGVSLDADMILVTADIESLYTSIRHADGLQAGTEVQLIQFMQDLNKNDLNIKLTYVFDKRRVEFLDILIEADETGHLQTDVFRKKTSVNALLHATSAHSQSTIDAVPTGQFLRMRRICSSNVNFERQSSDLRERFLDRGRYAVVFPSEVYTKQSELVCLHLEGMSGETSVKLALELEAGIITLFEKDFQENTYFSCIPFQVPEPSDGNVEVATISATIHHAGDPIYKKSKLLLRSERTATFIQTDKAIYKPGQTVKFRVVSLNENFRPGKNQFPAVELQDPEKNLIGQWLNVSLSQGIAELSIPLSSEPQLGEYSIRVKDKVHTFSVEEYVLPKFEVTLHLPKVIVTTDERFTLQVCGRYTYGKPVKGDYKIQICRKHVLSFDILRQAEPCANFTGKLDTSGCSAVEVPCKTLELSRTKMQMNLHGTASIKEEGTGIELSATSKTSISEVNTKVSFINSDTTYKPGIPLRIQAIANQTDYSLPSHYNVPIPSHSSAYLNLEHFRSRSKSYIKIRSQDHVLPCDGQQEFTVELDGPVSLFNLRNYNFRHNKSQIVISSFFFLQDLSLKIITSAHIKSSKIEGGPLLTFRSSSRKKVFVISSSTESVDDDDHIVMNRIVIPNKVQKQKSVTRHYFPETWIWKLEAVGDSGIAVLHDAAPDTITDWRGGAFCMGSGGFGLSPSATLRVFQPFFVDITLPYSVIRGETFTLKATVFNYLKQCIKVRTTLQPSAELEERPCNDCQYSSCLCVDESKTFYWNLKASKLGQVNITVTTEALDTQDLCHNEVPIVPKQGSIDAVVKPLLVQAGGVLEEKSYSSLLCSQGKDDSKVEEISLKVPENILMDSERAHIAVIGDLMGTAMQNLDRLLAMPYGCGEQNMVLFAPNIFILQYLEKTHQLNIEIKNKATNFLESGYQRELTYKREDGSYSAFGKSDPSGNTWLTAFVVKSFSKARPYIFIDEYHLKHSFSWLTKNQQADGCFRSVGRLFNNAMKGGVTDEISLSAYVTIALLEAGVSIEDPLVRDGVSCLMKAAEKVSTVYSQALLVYAFTLYGETELRKVLMDKLEAQVVRGNRELHWERESKPQSEDSYWYRAPSAEVELTSYVLLALLSGPTQDLVKASQIVNWLSKQQNPYGGFSSTQDTVVALQALAKYAEATFSDKGDVTVTVTSKKDFMKQFHVNNNNRLLLQSTSLPSIPGEYTLRSSGSGCVYVQTILRYNVPPPKREETFAINVETPSSECAEDSLAKLEIKITAQYTGSREKSNMVVIDVKMLSGYIPMKSTVRKLEKEKLIKRSDIQTDMVTLYLEELGKDSVTLSFFIEQDSKVKDLKPAIVKIYDYYETDEYAVTEYNSPCSG
ncbi:uncharacterized protein LOC142662932 [Rhinoderma darwinii]|uniref:uncharacterized protein LOC142662932 n=1 Tax=Rhinoderma darwinii TaxID=43563 RepID=UPI003F673122